MAKKVNATGIDRVLGLEFLDQVTKEVWTILRRTPPLGIGGVGPSDNKAFFFRQVLPLFHERNSGASRAMQHNHQWCRSIWLQRRRDIKIISSRLTF